jgi:hypothetical protein
MLIFWRAWRRFALEEVLDGLLASGTIVLPLAGIIKYDYGDVLTFRLCEPAELGGPRSEYSGWRTARYSEMRTVSLS